MPIEGGQSIRTISVESFRSAFVEAGREPLKLLAWRS